MAEAVTISAEATAEAAGKKDDEDNDKDEAQRRHGVPPSMASASALNLPAVQPPGKSRAAGTHIDCARRLITLLYD
jgi:hypothetical protein